MTEKKRAAAYVRVSTDRQAKEGLSLDEQRRRVEAHIAAQGWTLVDTFVERGVSGRKDDRPELNRLLAQVDAKAVDVVVIPKLDRFGRSVRQLHENFDRLDRSGVALVSLTESIDTSTSVGRLLRAVLAALAEFESDVIGDRVASVTAARAEQGKAHGRAPYGYRAAGKAGLLIVEHEAAIVRRMFREYLAGASQHQIKDALNRDGTPPQRGGEWVQGTVSKVLSNPIYAGKVRVNGKTYDGQHEAIVDAETWQKAEQMRAAALLSGRSRTPRAEHVLAGGLLRCGCGAPMHAITKPTRTPGVDYEVYACSRRPRCGQGPVKRGPIDTAVWSFFEQVAHDAEATKAAITNQYGVRMVEVDTLAAQADREAQKTAEQLTRIGGDYRDGKITAEQWGRLEATITSELQAARAQLAQLEARRQMMVADLERVDAEAGYVKHLADLRANIVGEVRESGRESTDAFRAVLRRLFSSFELLDLPDGKHDDREDEPPDPYAAPHPTLRLGPTTALIPRVREDAIAEWADGDDFPALRKAALSLRESDANTLHT